MTNWVQAFAAVENLRLARLCAYLRQRPPKGHAADSILVYELSEADLERALDGLPPFPKEGR